MGIYYITGRDEKFKEVSELIEGLTHRRVNLDEIQSNDQVSIIKNKLHSAWMYFGGTAPVIVDDTGLYLNCLNGFLGPLIRWFLEKIGDMGIYNLCYNCAGEVGAKAQAVIGYKWAYNEEKFFVGSVDGKIVSPRGQNNFSSSGFDRIFQPNGETKTFAEMTFEDKIKISHRTKAILQLKEFLESDH